MAEEIHIDPHTGVPRNLLGATSLEELEARAANISAVAVYQLELDPIEGRYDLAHLQAIHAHIFRAIYPWAGTLRTQRTNRGELFLDPHDIPIAAERLFTDLADRDHLRGLQPTEFAAELSRHYGRLNAIHPFSDGNGRTQRTFFGQLAHEAGYEMRWDRLSPGVNDTICREAMYEDYVALAVIFEDLVDPLAPIYGSPEETADALKQRARRAASAAFHSAVTAKDLSERGPYEGRLIMTYAEARADAVDNALSIELARQAQDEYEAKNRHLVGLEQRHANVLDALNPASGHIGRGRRQELLTQRQTLEEELRVTRTELAGLVTRVEEAKAEAGPTDRWDAARDLAVNLVEKQDRHDLYATLNEAKAIHDLEGLASGLTQLAKDIHQTAMAVQDKIVTPQQAGVPIGAVLPPPNLTPAGPTEQPPPPQAHP
jgi:cell filamentation protein, protein adenylyltransferase